MKRRSLSMLMVAVLMAGCSGGESDAPAAATTSFEKALRSGGSTELVRAYVDELEALAGLFEHVRDQASAKEFGPRIHATSDRLQQLADKMEGLSAVEKGMAFSQQTQRFMIIQQKMAPQIARISQDPELARQFGEAIQPPKIQ
jgi:hypothetical protein